MCKWWYFRKNMWWLLFIFTLYLLYKYKHFVIHSRKYVNSCCLLERSAACPAISCWHNINHLVCSKLSVLNYSLECWGYLEILYVCFSKQQFSSNVTRTSSHGISFSSRLGHRGVGGSHSKIAAASGSKWNVNEKMHHKPPVQVSFLSICIHFGKYSTCKDRIQSHSVLHVTGGAINLNFIVQCPWNEYDSLNRRQGRR
jgi:hypothetical protein